MALGVDYLKRIVGKSTACAAPLRVTLRGRSLDPLSDLARHGFRDVGLLPLDDPDIVTLTFIAGWSTRCCSSGGAIEALRRASVAML